MPQPTKKNDEFQTVLDGIPRAEFVELSYHNQVRGHSIPTRGWVEHVITTLVPEKTDRILHIGTGSGYMAAVLSRFVKTVITVEKDPLVAGAARDRFVQMNLHNINVICSNGILGAPEDRPFDKIFVSTPSIKDFSQLLDQLAEGGELFAIEEDSSREELIVSYRLDRDKKVVRSEKGPLPHHCDINRALLNLNYIDKVLLDKARTIAKEEHKPVIEIIRRMVDVDEVDLYRNLAAESGLEYRDFDSLVKIAQPRFFGKFSRAFLDLLHIIPIACDPGLIQVATYDPNASVDDIQKLYPHYEIQLTLVTLTNFRRLWSMLELILQGEMTQQQDFQKPDSKNHDEDLEQNPHTGIEAHLISVLDAILLDAASEKASDIHIEQYNGKLRLRFRIDGELRDFSHYQLSTREIHGLINVIKIRSDLNIAEKRAPQSGRSQMLVGKTHYDLRIQVQPSLHGEYVVIRLLPQTGKALGIDSLGLPDSIANAYQRLLKNPSGMVLVVGPTGSGKSTTLYAGLQLLADDRGRKVITIEDPIEYDIVNIQQTQVKPEIGFNFSDAMRSFVRLDPDVILIGEIRDHETALEALRASQTGHLVLSTLHCNDATDLQQRLFDLDVLPNSIASELMAVIAQRLAKRICPHCRREVAPDPTILRELFPTEVPSGFKTYAGRGCNHCHQRGTQGRVAVVEFLQVNDEIKAAISRKASTLELRTIALENGLVTMRDSALQHVVNGIIPLSELPRILPADRMGPERRGGVQRLRAI